MLRRRGATSSSSTMAITVYQTLSVPTCSKPWAIGSPVAGCRAEVCEDMILWKIIGSKSMLYLTRKAVKSWTDEEACQRIARQGSRAETKIGGARKIVSAAG